eukprot:gene20342-22345_t
MENSPPRSQNCSSAAKKRWKILSETLLKHKVGSTGLNSTSQVSVRRFKGFEIFTYEKIDADEEGVWLWMSYENKKTIKIRLLHGRIHPEVLIGFNNTGNVCIWPAEEVMAHYCIKMKHRFCAKTICEVGGGMTSLAGLLLAVSIEARLIYLTDGNKESAENIQAILDRNQDKLLTKNVTSGQLVWGSLNHSDVCQRYDYVLCADCLFFVEHHQDLINTLCNILDDQGEAIIFAPRRGNTLELFIEKAKSLFQINIMEEYDTDISEKHKVYKNQPWYDEDIHYPLLLIFKKFNE